MKKVAIITGTSRGLGLNLAKQFLEAGFTVVGISRSNVIKGKNFYFLKLDLADPKNLRQKLAKFLADHKISLKNDHTVLINNAATVFPVHYFHKVKENDIQESYYLNLHAPMMLSHFVITKSLEKSKHVTICNISSGAAVRPLENWSIYCSMKSALKMFTDCLNVDYAESSQFKAFSFYPGVMDTKMQAVIRQQKIENFKNIESFKELKNKNKLIDPNYVAQAILKIISRPMQIDKTEYNIKDL